MATIGGYSTAKTAKRADARNVDAERQQEQDRTHSARRRQRRRIRVAEAGRRPRSAQRGS